MSKFLGKLARKLERSAKHEAYFKSAVIENLQGINQAVNPTQKPVDMFAEINRVNEELRSKEKIRLKDREAVEDLIKDII
jgi:hypothetical protein